jgi:hypothetical protein
VCSEKNIGGPCGSVNPTDARLGSAARR